MIRTKDSSKINLPFRLLSLDTGYSFESFDIKINVGKKAKQFLNLFDSQYKFIDNKKNINIAAYCFECDFIQPE